MFDEEEEDDDEEPKIPMLTVFSGVMALAVISVLVAFHSE